MPAPANDDIANAQVLVVGSTQVTGDTTSATVQTSEFNYTTASGYDSTTTKTVWFRWRAPASGSQTLTTIGSAFDTVLSIYIPSTSTPTDYIADLYSGAVAGDNDGGGGTASSVTFTAVRGTEYWVQLSGKTAGAGGLYTLNYPAPGSLTTPYVGGPPLATSFTTSGTVVTYSGGGPTGTGCYDVLCVNSDNTVFTPSGWTAQVTAVTNQGAYIFTKAENGTNTATISLGGGISSNTDVFWLRIANATGTFQSDSSQANSSSGTTTPALTSSTLASANFLSLAFAALHAFVSSDPTAGSWSTGYTEQANAKIGGGAGAGTATYGSVGVKAPAGPSTELPAFSWTNATTDRYVLWLAFQPVPLATSAPAGQSAVAVAAYNAAVSVPINAPAGQSAVGTTAYDAVVAVGASGAVLTLDASSPGTSTANAQTVQTASFTPPAGSMLYAIALHAAASPTATRTITITDTVGLTWTLQASSPLGPVPAPAGSVAVIYSAPVISSAAMRVTSTITSNGLNGVLLKVFVYTGADQANPVDQAVAGHSAGAVVSQAITTTIPGTIPYLGNIDAGGQAAPTTAAGTGTFTTAKPNVDQMWIARGSPAVVATPSTVTLASTAPTTGTVNDWVMFGIRAVLINHATVAVTAYDATVSTSSGVNAPAEQPSVAVSALDANTANGNLTQDAAVTTAAYDATASTSSSVSPAAEQTAVAVSALDAATANGNLTQDAAVTAAAQDALVANGNATEPAAVTTAALDASTANGNLTQDAAVGVTGYDATVSTSSSVSAAAEQTAVGATAYDATVTVSGSTLAPADYSPVTTTALSPYIDAATIADIANVTAAAYLATVAVAINPAADVAQVTTAAYDATTSLAGLSPAETTSVTAAAYDATTATAAATTAPAAPAAVTAAAFNASVAAGVGAELALVSVIAVQPPPPGVTSSPNRVLTTSSRENSITTITTQRLIITQ